MDEKPSLKDTLTTAFDEATAEPDAKAAPVNSEPEQKAEQKTAPEPNAEPKPIKRPSSWKKDYWEKFDGLDEELRGYILQREDESLRGISNYKAEAERAQKLFEAMAPFQDELQQYGIDPAQHIQNLFSAHRTLALADPQTKLQFFAKLAQDYGVPLQALLGGQQQVDPYYQQLAQQVSGLQQSLQTMTQAQQQAAQSEADNEVVSMAGDATNYPHFSTVREKMAGLLQAGLADDLKSAYEQAVRLEPEIFDKMVAEKQAAQAVETAKAKDAAAKAAREKAVSVRGTAPGPTDTSRKGLRANLEAAFDSHVSGGRI